MLERFLHASHAQPYKRVAKRTMMKLSGRQLALWTLGLVISCALTGCGVAPGDRASLQGAALSGQIHGGQQPIAGAAVFLYAAGTSAPNEGANNLLKTAVTSDSNGLFNITNDYTCPTSATQVYLVAQGGNPGLSEGSANASSLLITALGDCGKLTPYTYVTINEVTTVGAAWALAQFLSPGALVNSSTSNAIGLENAFYVASSLVDPATGIAVGPGLSTDATIEATKLNTLADILGTCVNSDGTDACQPLFHAATIGSVEPTNTLDAALNVVLHPGVDLSIPVGNISARSPFQPTLPSSPHDWTMSISYVGGGLDGPAGLAVNSQGEVWVANSLGNTVTRISANGQVSGVSDPSIEETVSLTVDSQDNVWVSDQQSPSINNGYGSVTKFNRDGQVISGEGYTAGGIYFPYAVAADSNGTVWVADYGSATATLLASDGSSLSGSAGYKSNTDLPFPNTVALDSDHNAWFGAEGTATKVSPSGTMVAYKCCNSPSGIEVDPTGNVWISDYSGSSLVEISANGEPIQTLNDIAGIQYPEGLAIDGVGNVWVPNVHSSSFSGVTAATGGAKSKALSPAAGFGLDAGLQEPYGDAIDASGNLWVSSHADNVITEFVGLASPVATPLLGPPKQP
jgi:streptogramin lyase